MRRVLSSLLHWRLLYDARRPKIWLFSGLLIGLVLLVFLPLNVHLLHRNRASSFRDVITPLWNISFLLTLALALDRGTDACDDLAPGMPTLFRLTELSPYRWAVYRVMVLLLGALPAWLVRLPILVLGYWLGEAPTKFVIITELQLMTLYLTLGMFASAAARWRSTKQGAGSSAIGMLLLLEFLLRAPDALVRMLRDAGLLAGRLDENLAAVTSALRNSALFGGGAGPPANAQAWARFVAGLLLYGAVAGGVLALAASRMRLAAEIHDGAGLAGAPRSAAVRVSRRAWRHALAWQAWGVHGGGVRIVLIKLLAYAAAGLTIFALKSSDNGLWVIVAGVSGFFAATMAAQKPSDCLLREIRGETLATLATLPYDGRTIYRGWVWGARGLAAPDIAWVLATSALLVRWDEKLGALWVGLNGGLLLAGPLLFVMQLYKLTWSNVPSLFGVLLAIGAAGGPCVAAYREGGPWGALGMLAALMALARMTAGAMMPRMFEERVNRER